MKNTNNPALQFLVKKTSQALINHVQIKEQIGGVQKFNYRPIRAGVRNLKSVQKGPP